MRYIILLLIVFTSNIVHAGPRYSKTTEIITPTFTVVEPTSTEQSADMSSNVTKGYSFVDETTQATWTRRSDLSELNSVNTDSMIVYSRYSPTNSSGDLLLVHGTNSTSCYVYRLSNNSLIADLKRDSTHQIGEINEIRWDYSGDNPNRIYFVQGMSFYYMDVVTNNGSPTLIRDFALDFPTGDRIRNDVEGDSSSDSRYWAWQVYGEYDGSRFPKIAFITYDIQSNIIVGILRPGDVVPAQNADLWTSRFPDPNMIEISPDGNYVLTHYSKSYQGGPTQDFDDTYFDGTFAWNLDFSGTPIQVSVSETHSGWGYLEDGSLVFVSQQNSTDYLEYCRVDGVGGPYPGNCENFMDHGALAYFGFHMAKMPASTPGWILISTADKIYQGGWQPNTAYSAGDKVIVNGIIHRSDQTGTSGSNEPTWATSSGQSTADGAISWRYWGQGWPANQLFMAELKPLRENPRVWRISPMYNDYQGDYRDEASAAISMDGNKIYVTNNFMNPETGHGEVYEIDITGWADHLRPLTIDEINVE